MKFTNKYESKQSALMIDPAPHQISKSSKELPASFKSISHAQKCIQTQKLYCHCVRYICHDLHDRIKVWSSLPDNARVAWHALKASDSVNIQHHAGKLFPWSFAGVSYVLRPK